MVADRRQRRQWQQSGINLETNQGVTRDGPRFNVLSNFEEDTVGIQGRISDTFHFG